MKPRISKSEFDQMHKILKERNSGYGRYLEVLLKNYDQVNDNELPSDIIRINSTVELWHEILQKKVKFQMVLPANMDLKKRKLSVFSPVCLAILGRIPCEEVETSRAGIQKKYKILSVKN